ncbi:hypothetical protein [Spiroplasma endosymbiont of Atherix ibis]|uniref:hypothetical protein n=1 Tax=Spiroplasma endosymbiont of Atherix ibis TaxID=3066291 RepID=UPI0030CE7018
MEVEKYKVTDSYYDLAVAMGYADFVAPVIGIGVAGGSSYQHKLPDFKLAISYSMNGENDEISDSFIDLSLKLFGVYKKVWDPKVRKEDNPKFDLDYRRNSIWKAKKFQNYDMDIKQINHYLNDYEQFYFIDLEKALNLLDMTRNVFTSSNILYSIDANNYDKKVSSISFRNDNSTEYTYYFKVDFIESSNSSDFFANINYLTFDLFGIVKMNIYLKKDKQKFRVF